MFEALANEQKFDNERLNKELNELKIKYYGLKNKEQTYNNDKQTAITILPSISLSEKKIYGGGFNMTVTKSQIN